jgi:hypothetical protein
MSRPEIIMKQTQCPHGFSALICNRCMAAPACMHGMPSGCLLCFMRNSRSLFGIAGVATVVTLLKATCGLGESDIYEHDKIAYKTLGEGAGLCDGGV